MPKTGGIGARKSKATAVASAAGRVLGDNRYPQEALGGQRNREQGAIWGAIYARFYLNLGCPIDPLEVPPYEGTLRCYRF
ncbi:hypothetical protein GCM10023352_09620 [Rothia endophytica]|uniref:Uncharacterized protein n=1 Tax=Rothia endophytica TaxID=1324766 RepID=A0ABP9BB70_9MICC